MAGTYVVTGGSSGIGKAVSSQLREKGYRVITVSRTNADIKADLSSMEGWQSAVRAIKEITSEGIEGLIPCAGVGPNVENRTSIVHLNYHAVKYLCEALSDDLQSAGGSIVLISSVSASIQKDDALYAAITADDTREIARLVALESGISGASIYATVKLCLSSWMRSNTKFFSDRNIRINAVVAGPTDTPLIRSLLEHEDYSEVYSNFSSFIPLGRIARSDEIAEVIAFLACRSSSYITGANVYADGGLDALLRPDLF